VSEELTARERAERRRRLAEIFGEVIPEQTSDDADVAGVDAASAELVREAWLRRQVPPHHS
jgi:hypothetical protein